MLLLFIVVWVIIPPPNRFFWLWSIGVGEWSMWFGAAAAIVITAAVLARLYEGHGWLWLPAAVIAAAALAITLYPLFSILPLARKTSVPLSLRRYFRGLPARDYFFAYKEKSFTTYSFSSPSSESENDLQLDVYLPTAKTENNGASIIVVHGGSWNGGRRSDFPRWNGWLCDRGFTVFDVDYRLSPQPNYLTAPDDIKTAVRWVKEHSAEFNIDPQRLALMGRSAGAHIALLAAYTMDGVRAAVSFYGPVDLLWAYDIRGNKKVHDGPLSLINFLGGRPGDSEEMRERYLTASPVSYVNESTPPTFLAHGGRDGLVWWKNMERLGEKLAAAHVPHEIHFIAYAHHGFDYNLNGWGSQVTGELVLRFLTRYLSS